MTDASRMSLAEKDGIARLTLDDGRANAIGSAFLAELEAKLDAVAASDAFALVIFAMVVGEVIGRRFLDPYWRALTRHCAWHRRDPARPDHRDLRPRVRR